MLSTFGKLALVQLDHGPDTLDRLVALHMLGSHKVYAYREWGTRQLFAYQLELMVGGAPEYTGS